MRRLILTLLICFIISPSDSLSLLQEPLEYQWCCEKQTFPFAGSPCDNTAFPLGGFCSDFSATIPARSFNSQARQFQVGEYLFTLNLRQGERTATYDVLIEVLAENIPTVHTEEIETYYVDATQPVLLKVFSFFFVILCLSFFFCVNPFNFFQQLISFNLGIFRRSILTGC